MPTSPGPRGRRPANGEPVIDRVFRLLGAFNVEDPSLSLTELSGRAQLPLSTALRLARKLVELGVLERTTDGRYAIGLTLLEMASLAPRGHGLRAIAMPFMEDLHHATRHHVMLAVLENDYAVLVERLSAHKAGRIMYRIGGRLPLHATGVGQVLLAHSNAEFQEGILARELLLEPEGTKFSSRELRAALAAVRRDGVAVVTRPLPEPLTSVAVPIFAGRQLVASVAIIGPIGTIEPRIISPALVAVGRAISRAVSSPAGP